MKTVLTTMQSTASKTLLTKKMATTLAISIFMLLAATVNTNSQAEIYKWTDVNGVTHYSSQKPVKKKIKSENIEDKIRFAAGKYKAPSKQSAQNSAKPTAKVKGDKSKEKIAGPSAKLVSFCKTQRTNLAQLKKNYRNVWQDKDGKKSRLNQKQRKNKVNLLQKSITDECAGV
jgi:hypothetical protein